MINEVTNIYFLGIGGIGMSALARYFHDRGVSVSGYDKTASALTNALQQEGITISYTDDPATISSKPQLVVYTPAVPQSTALYQHFVSQHIPVLKRSAVLGLLSEETPTIAVAGTHGKTTVTAMLTHIMKTAEVPCIAFPGGIPTNYNTNFIGDPNPQWMIAEADEFDRSFLKLSPAIALISSMDADHLDVYESREELISSFRHFAERLPSDGVLITKKGIRGIRPGDKIHLQYHSEEKTDYCLENVRVMQGRYHADIAGMIDVEGIHLLHPGYHNLENALAAAALAHQAGVTPEAIKKGLNSFMGVKRRFEICFQTENTVYVDDYAHHPEEIRACIRSARAIWPGKKITGVFQPHLYSRTRDLAEGFAKSLQELDELLLLDIYPAREEPIPGINAEYLLEKTNMNNAQHCRRENLLDIIREKDTEILITMGAGDIDLFAAPITELLKNKNLSL